MKHQLRRMLCIAAALLLPAGCLQNVHTLFPDSVLTASAAEGWRSGTCGLDVVWSLDRGVLTVAGDGPMNYVPEEEDVPWYEYKDKIRSAVIQEGVHEISNMAFHGCGALTDVTFADSLQVIDGTAFLGTPWMKAQQAENPLVTFNSILINGQTCKGDITVPDDIETISGYAFEQNTNLTKITFPDSVWRIDTAAFSGCSALKEITLPPRLKKIQYALLKGCSSLTSVKIPYQVSLVGSCAFMDCTSLKEITVPDSVHDIYEQAFCGCTALQSITILDPECIIEGNAQTICNTYDSEGENAVFKGVIRGYDNSTAQEYAEKYGYSFESLGDASKRPRVFGEDLTWTLEDGVLTISGTGAMPDYDFLMNTPWENVRDSIQRVVLEEGVTSIGDYAFTQCSALASVSIPETVKSIGYLAFDSCTALKTVKIPGNVEIVGPAAFSDCTSLTTVYMLDGVKFVGGSAFQGCIGLRAVRIPESLTTIGACAFLDTQWLKIHKEETPLLIVNNTVIDGSTCSGDVIIPEGVTAIAGSAFEKNAKLESVVIPDTVTSIGSSTFENCEYLKKVTMPKLLCAERDHDSGRRDRDQCLHIHACFQSGLGDASFNPDLDRRLCVQGMHRSERDFDPGECGRDPGFGI